jgi:hypothetical protein
VSNEGVCPPIPASIRQHHRVRACACREYHNSRLGGAGMCEGDNGKAGCACARQTQPQTHPQPIPPSPAEHRPGQHIDTCAATSSSPSPHPVSACKPTMGAMTIMQQAWHVAANNHVPYQVQPKNGSQPGVQGLHAFLVTTSRRQIPSYCSVPGLARLQPCMGMKACPLPHTCQAAVHTAAGT